MSNHTWVNFCGKRIYVTECGKVDATTPILLIHGFGASSKVWELMVPTLSAGYRVISLDLLGHGQSDKSDDGYGVAIQAQAAHAVLDHFDIGKAHIVAHSAGGDTAIAMNEQKRERIGATCLLGTAPNLSFVEAGFSAKLIRIPLLGELIWNNASDAMLRDGLLKTFAPGRKNIPDVYVHALRQMTYQSYVQGIAAIETYQVGRDLCLRASDVAVKPLVLWGAQDQWVHPSAATYWEQATGAQVRMLENVGHTAMAEAPEQAAMLVLNYLT
jgi:pimeloyl-ACP methyl ester carboxylesterase